MQKLSMEWSVAIHHPCVDTRIAATKWEILKKRQMPQANGLDQSQRGCGGFLLNYAEFRAAVEGPGLLGARWIGGHFAAEADRLDEVGIHAGIDE